MFKKENLHLLGSLIKTHGVHGECVLKINTLKPEAIHEIESVFMEIDGLLVPYFISQLSDRDQSSLIIKFDDIDSKDKAGELIGCDIYIPQDSINFHDNTDSEAPDLTGYEIVDKKHGNIGRIISTRLKYSFLFTIAVNHDKFLDLVYAGFFSEYVPFVQIVRKPVMGIMLFPGVIQCFGICKFLSRCPVLPVLPEG